MKRPHPSRRKIPRRAALLPLPPLHLVPLQSFLFSPTHSFSLPGHFHSWLSRKWWSGRSPTTGRQVAWCSLPPENTPNLSPQSREPRKGAVRSARNGHALIRSLLPLSYSLSLTAVGKALRSESTARTSRHCIQVMEKIGDLGLKI